MACSYSPTLVYHMTENQKLMEELFISCRWHDSDEVNGGQLHEVGERHLDLAEFEDSEILETLNELQV